MYSSRHFEYGYSGNLALHVKQERSFTAMVRVRMSARLYPLRGGIVQTMGIRVRYPLLWAKMSGEFCMKWKLVVQQIEQPRLSQALKAKRDSAACIELGCCVGLWEAVEHRW